MTRMRAVVYTVRQLGEIMSADETETLSAVHDEASEWADIIALAVQRLMEMGLEPRQMLLDRILSRYENREQMQHIIDTYAEWYEREFGEEG